MGQDGRPQDLLPGPGVLLGDELAVQHQPGVVVQEQEEVGLTAAGHPRARDVGPVQDVADPDLIGSVGLEAPVHTRLSGEPCAVQAPAAQVLADGARGDAHLASRQQDARDLLGRPEGCFPTQPAGLLEQPGLLSDQALVGARLGTQGGQLPLSIGPDPAIQGGPAELLAAAVGQFMGTGGQLAYEPSSLGRAQPFTERLGDDAVAEQGELFGWILSHRAPPEVSCRPFQPSPKLMPSPVPCWQLAPCR